MPAQSSLHLVFSKPPGGVGDAAFNQWYERHLDEILRVPAFRGARRYALRARLGTAAPAVFPFLSAYEVEGDIAPALASLDDDRRAGRMDLPPWFDGIRFASWHCTPLAPRHELVLSGDFLFVLSGPPAPVAFDDYSAWYESHVAENVLHSPALRRAWRFRVEPGVVDPAIGPAAEMTHLALYEVAGEIADVSAGLHRFVDAGAIRRPEWFGGIAFTSIGAEAISDRRTRMS